MAWNWWCHVVEQNGVWSSSLNFVEIVGEKNGKRTRGTFLQCSHVNHVNRHIYLSAMPIQTVNRRRIFSFVLFWSILIVTHLLEASWLSFRLCSTEFLVSTSMRNEWISCWSSKQQFPSLKRKPERSVCHWCHRQQTTLQTRNKAAGVFTPKHRGPYLFKPHTLCVPPCFYWGCALMVPTSDSQWPQSHMTAMHRPLHPPQLTSNGPGQLVCSLDRAKWASDGASQWGMQTDWMRKQSSIYWKSHLGCTDSNLTLI